MSEAVIARIERLALGQPSQPVFTDRKGLPIGDIAMGSVEPYDLVEADDDLPGVHLESTKSAEIPGVGSTDQDPSDDVPDLADAFDVDVDFDSQANPQNIVQMDNDSPVPEVEIPLVELGVGDTLADGTAEAPSVPIGVRWSTRERKQVKSYKPSLTGQKYVFAAMALATTQLGQSYLYDDSYQHDADVAYAFMQQLSLKSALKQWGTNAEDAGVKEISQLHWRDTFVPRRYSDLTDELKKKVLESHMFVVKK
jgi:hypothetical protein